jgi:hypothetical protein
MQFYVQLDIMQRWVKFTIDAKCPDLLPFLLRGWMVESTKFPYENLHLLIPDMPNEIGAVQAAWLTAAKKMVSEKPFPFRNGVPKRLYVGSLFTANHFC